MTDNNHPITPPPELVEQWANEQDFPTFTDIATLAARWGADMELEACINHFHEYDTSWGEDSDLIAGLRAARRPKPPSLKEQALKELHHLVERLPEGTLFSDAAILRALESLPS